MSILYGTVPTPKALTIARIVAEDAGVSVDDLRGTSHKRCYSWPRHVAFALTQELTGASTTNIARFYHRDHGTIVKGVGRVRARMCNPEYAAAYAKLRSVVKDGLEK